MGLRKDLSYGPEEGNLSYEKLFQISFLSSKLLFGTFIIPKLLL